LTLAVALLIAIALVAATLLHRRRGGRRERVLAAVLDSADALEARLRAARAEIEAIAGDADNPVRDAMQEMLRQRLWLQQHGQEASIDAASARIEQQLARIERARAQQV